MTSTRATTKPRKATFRIQVLNRQRRFRIFSEPIARLCSCALRALGRQPCALTVAFVGHRTIRKLNARYRDRDHPTDVLSFSYGREWDERMRYLGDVVVAVDVAWEHAKSRGIPLDGEIRRLLVHGLLHLLGYDHETDSGEMIRLQAGLLRRRFVTDTRAVLAGAAEPRTNPVRRRTSRC